MKLKIKNLMAIKSAEIHLDGISVIVGKNSTGKSTIARSFFTNIKSINLSKKYYGEILSKELFLSSNFNELGFSYFEISKKATDLAQKINGRNYEEVNKTLEEIRIVANQKNNTQIVAILNKVEKAIETFKQNKVPDWVFSQVYMNIVRDVTGVVHSDYVFQTNRSGSNDYSEVLFNWEGVCNLTYNVKDNGLGLMSMVSLSNELSDLDVDVTYISSPSLMDLNKVICDSRSDFEDNIWPLGMGSNENRVPFVYKDFSVKLKKDSAYSFKSKSFENVNIAYDSKKNMFLEHINGSSISSFASASGRKMFYQIMKIIDDQIWQKSSVIVLDEPEVHLHPEAQVELAKIIVDTYEQTGIKFLINSHSSYFIEAIYASSLSIKRKSPRYYFSTKDKDGKIVYREEVGEIDSMLRSFLGGFDEIKKIYGAQK